MSRLAGIGLVILLALAGCSAPAASAPAQPAMTVTVTVAASSPSPSAPKEVCDYGVMGDGAMAIIIDGWDLVKASRGASDHAKMVDGFMDSIKSAQTSETKGCVGSVESAKLLFETSILNAEVQFKDRGAAEDYRTIVDAGNAWFDAIGFTKYRFTMGKRDLAN